MRELKREIPLGGQEFGDGWRNIVRQGNRISLDHNSLVRMSLCCHGGLQWYSERIVIMQILDFIRLLSGILNSD